MRLQGSSLEYHNPAQTDTICHILHHLQKRIPITLQLGLPNPANLPNLGQTARPAVEDFQQGAVVKDDVGRYALFVCQFGALGLADFAPGRLCITSKPLIALFTWTCRVLTALNLDEAENSFMALTRHADRSAGHGAIS